MNPKPPAAIHHHLINPFSFHVCTATKLHGWCNFRKCYTYYTVTFHSSSSSDCTLKTSNIQAFPQFSSARCTTANDSSYVVEQELVSGACMSVTSMPKCLCKFHWVFISVIVSYYCKREASNFQIEIAKLCCAAADLRSAQALIFWRSSCFWSWCLIAS